MISDFRAKKLVEYLEPGQRVLIRFGHGLGDTIMFMPAFEALKAGHPDIRFHLYVESGQEKVWPSVPDKDAPDYDHVFSLNFPMAEGSGLTKQELCCRDELGIFPPVQDVASIPRYDSPIVCCHFQGTALPYSVSWPEDKSAEVWQGVRDAGKAPLECHFRHVFHNPVNEKYGFVDAHVRECRAELRSLIGLLQHSFAFIGVASGPFVAALSIMRHRILFLESRHRANDYTRLPVPVLTLHEESPRQAVAQWLRELEEA